MLEIDKRRKLRNKISIGSKGEIAAIRPDGSLFLMYTQKTPDDVIEADYWAHLDSIQINDQFVAALRDDGTVLLMDEYGEDKSELTSTWPQIIEIAATQYQIFGLDQSGKLHATYGSIDHECLNAIGQYKHVFAGKHCIVCLDNTGSAVGAGAGNLPPIITNIVQIKDIFCSNTLDETVALLCDGTLLGSSIVKESIYVPSEDKGSVIQCGINDNSEAIYLTENPLFKYRQLYKERRLLCYGQDDLSFFDAFSMSKGASNAIIAASQYNDNSFAVAVWGIPLNSNEAHKLKHFYLHTAMTSADKKNNRDLTEKKLRVLHAIDGLSEIKMNTNKSVARQMETNLSQLESTIALHRKKMDGIVGIISLFLNTSYYHKLQKQWDHLLTDRNELYERYYDLRNWNGPYRITNPNGKYSCLGWCSSDPLELIVWRRHLSGSEKPVRPLLAKISEKEWAKYAWKKETLCIDCIVSHNLYCVVCGEVINPSDNKVEYDGYCICGECTADRQEHYTLASEYVGRCCSCGKQHVPLKLHDKKLLCEECHDYENHNN